MRARRLLVPAFALLVSLAHGAQTTRRLSVAVLDENGVAVPGARVTLQPPSPAQALRCETEISGRCELPHDPGRALPDPRREGGLLYRELLSRTLWRF